MRLSNLASSGNSLHDLAGNLSGPITMIGAGGDVISSAAGELSAGLANIFSPGSGDWQKGVNCLVARFIAFKRHRQKQRDFRSIRWRRRQPVMATSICAAKRSVSISTSKTKLVDGRGCADRACRGTLSNQCRRRPETVVQNVWAVFDGGRSLNYECPICRRTRGRMPAPIRSTIPPPLPTSAAPSKGGA